MAGLNGGIIGKDNTPEQQSVSETITTFTSSGTLTLQPATTQVDYLVIGGGGGGGRGANFGGGGGGAGGYRTGSSFSVSGPTIPVTVGAGGTAQSQGSSPYANHGTDGSNSVFSSITANGGGGGAGYYGKPGRDGGSGGGGVGGPGVYACGS